MEKSSGLVSLAMAFHFCASPPPDSELAVVQAEKLRGSSQRLRLNRLFDILTEKWFSVLVEPFPNALELGLLRCLNRWSDDRHPSTV